MLHHFLILDSMALQDILQTTTTNIRLNWPATIIGPCSVLTEEDSITITWSHRLHVNSAGSSEPINTAGAAGAISAHNDWFNSIPNSCWSNVHSVTQPRIVVENKSLIGLGFTIREWLKLPQR